MKASANNPLRVLITDDHPTTRIGMRQILEEEFPGMVVVEAGTATESMKRLGERRWNLLILDITLHDRDGLEFLREVKQAHPQLPVLMFSVHPENQFAVRAIKWQASGYLTKERAPEQLADAVRKILAGGLYLTGSLAEQMAGRLASRSGTLPHEQLSDREFQVLLLLAGGMPGKAIGDDLGISQKTISTYRMRLLKKMNMKTTADLIQYAVRHHLTA